MPALRKRMVCLREVTKKVQSSRGNNKYFSVPPMMSLPNQKTRGERSQNQVLVHEEADEDDDFLPELVPASHNQLPGVEVIVSGSRLVRSIHTSRLLQFHHDVMNDDNHLSYSSDDESTASMEVEEGDDNNSFPEEIVSSSVNNHVNATNDCGHYATATENGPPVPAEIVSSSEFVSSSSDALPAKMVKIIQTLLLVSFLPL
jgi:hypothetical protein